jgi:colanic acid biosynthesis glycosyl transferase WcaI
MFGLPPEKIVILYSGSMGSKQGLETLVDAARNLQDRSDLIFVLCGEGSARAELERATRSLSNVRLLDLQPAERLNQLLNAADIHVLPQRAGAADLVMPSKLLGMLASGRPTIAMAAPGTEVGDVVSGAGVTIAPGEPALLCRAILELASSPGLRSEHGARGRAYVVHNRSAQRILEELQSQLQDMQPENPAGRESERREAILKQE